MGYPHKQGECPECGDVCPCCGRKLTDAEKQLKIMRDSGKAFIPVYVRPVYVEPFNPYPSRPFEVTCTADGGIRGQLN